MSTVYLVPCYLDDTATNTIPTYVLNAVLNCTVIFAENERSARRYLKSLSREIVIDNFEWFTIHKAEAEQVNTFRQKVKEGKNIAIISEAGCPGVADPGQILIAVAQEMKCVVKPLVGPSSILLALMASGMNGQHFEFAGYLPIDAGAREKALKELEAGSQKNNSTKIFIETPYRNNQLMEGLLKSCNGKTRLCVAVNLTGGNEKITTMSIAEWKTAKIDLHKQPAIFLINAGA